MCSDGSGQQRHVAHSRKRTIIIKPTKYLTESKLVVKYTPQHLMIRDSLKLIANQMLRVTLH